MTTKLDSALRREIEVAGHPYTVLLTPEYVRVTPKGKRKGLELPWKELLNGDKALAAALNASLGNLPAGAKAGNPAAIRTRKKKSTRPGGRHRAAI